MSGPASTDVFAAREADWRKGAIVYQVLVDRFAPSARLAEKLSLYPPPKVLKAWDESPQRGRWLDTCAVWSHEIDFWGGDLESTCARLDHLVTVGADVLYLNPVHVAWTNHKYDAQDFAQISPEFGSRETLRALFAAAHARGLRVVLDGVFNHVGRRSSWFIEACADPASPWRDAFFFGPQYPGGARTWSLAPNLPELRLETPRVREFVYGGRDAVVRTYLRDGADGWRLDVAHDIGPEILAGITRAAHEEKAGSLVVGEIANYPRDWCPAVDGVINFTLRELVLAMAGGRLDPATAARMVGRVVLDAGIEPMLNSWLMLDNHDTPRLATALPQASSRRIAQVLQFTLPGSPNLYYGSELGMTGGDDPLNRAPMRWDLAHDDNEELAWTRSLVALRRAHRALRVGEFRAVTAQRVFAFERHTDRVADTVVVAVNPGSDAVSEPVLVANSGLMNAGRMIAQLGQGDGNEVIVSAGLVQLSLAPRSFVVLTPEISPAGGYSAYKRVR